MEKIIMKKAILLTSILSMHAYTYTMEQPQRNSSECFAPLIETALKLFNNGQQIEKHIASTQQSLSIIPLEDQLPLAAERRTLLISATAAYTSSPKMRSSTITPQEFLANSVEMLHKINLQLERWQDLDTRASELAAHYK